MFLFKRPKKPSKTYRPNGKAEVARRKRQLWLKQLHPVYDE